MNKAEIVSGSNDFEVILNDIAADPSINSKRFSALKSNIVEWSLMKDVDGSGEFVSWQYPSGKTFDTSAEIVSRGVDNGIITWFTDDDTETGNPDNTKLYLWVKERR